ncbi:translation elongation factor Ts [Saccharicrinis fermentans]|uniref:Elongation factor Ts n=1 Tax=Saccharicrinis fermentans DSM 9555 = JCM 21142 TaxID=869213 RepID=W7YQR6_9BACT|nr:translation elongation factor Ts [Saccharicrinis fermentans]GAF04774.1 elongation factor Ts [Saccharicrinis fermentans DSM 9555 = JCM 21142]
MAIKAADVSKLRKMTGAGMMDCKKALTETDGDFDAAVEIIRKKGQAMASKRADRETSEGSSRAIVSADGKKGAVLILKCETDFVGKNESFVALADSILETALNSNVTTKEAILDLEINGLSVKDVITEQIGVIGEKIEIEEYGVIEAEKVVAYIHPGSQLSVIVGFNQADFEEQVGKDVAMQVAAMAPVSVDKDSVPADVVETELRIGREKAKEEGKPEAMLDKIAQGRLGKFFKESTLLEQAFVKDNKKSIKQYLTEASADLTVTEFKRLSLS